MSADRLRAAFDLRRAAAPASAWQGARTLASGGPSACVSGDSWRRQFLRRDGQSAADSFRQRSEVNASGLRSAKAARVEAVLFLNDAALSSRRLAQLATLADSGEARAIIDQLNAAYEHDGSAFRIERAANGYLLLTRPAFARWLGRLHHRQVEMKLTPSAMETLTVVAYRQPITRADVEALRGVHCTDILKQLMERGLVRIAGEDNSLGRPYLYETTRRFLEAFGLRSLENLPRVDRLQLVEGGAAAARRSAEQPA